MARNDSTTFWIALACSLLCLGFWEPQAAPAQAPTTNGLTFKVQAAAERMEMTVNTSRIVEMPFKVPRLYVGAPDVVKAAPLSPTQVQITALKPGITQINVWDEEDKITTIDVVIYGDSRELEMLLKSEFPDAQLKIRPLASSVYISGFVSKAEQVGQIVRMAEDYYPKVVNNLGVGGVQQILLNVKVMEVSRTKMRSMGIDWSTVNGNFFLTQRAGDIVSNIDQQSGLPIVLAQGAGKDSIRFGLVAGGDQYFGFLEMLRQNDMAKLLAEPKLTTLSGRPASFNVGGQLPIPVAQSLGTVTVQYKDFGTQIDFVPIALGNGNIRLEVRPDITEVDPSLRDTTTGVPGFRRRFADTAVEMKAGQTMAVAGLIYYRLDSSNRGVPWLADLPWIGSAFRRTKETANEVELVITVTPEFVDAMDPEEVPDCGPGQMTRSPNDTELYHRGYMEVPKCGPGGNGAANAPQNGCAPGNGMGAAPNQASAQYAAQTPAPRQTTTPTQRPRMTPVSTRRSVSDDSPLNISAGEPSPAPIVSGSGSNGNTSGSTGSLKYGASSGEPGLIGPLGYDRLK